MCAIGGVGLVLLAALAVPVSGQWDLVAPEDTNRLCQDLRLCTASQYTWSTASTYDNQSGCALLKRKGIKQMTLCGDSYMRHLYLGLTLTLSGVLRHISATLVIRTCFIIT